MICKCSAGVSEYISPVPPAATTAQTGCSSSRVKFCRRPSVSSDRSLLKGVIGKAITPEKLSRKSFGFIMPIYINEKQPVRGQSMNFAEARPGRRATVFPFALAPAMKHKDELRLFGQCRPTQPPNAVPLPDPRRRANPQAE